MLYNITFSRRLVNEFDYAELKRVFKFMKQEFHGDYLLLNREVHSMLSFSPNKMELCHKIIAIYNARTRSRISLNKNLLTHGDDD